MKRKPDILPEALPEQQLNKEETNKKQKIENSNNNNNNNNNEICNTELSITFVASLKIIFSHYLDHQSKLQFRSTSSIFKAQEYIQEYQITKGNYSKHFQSLFLYVRYHRNNELEQTLENNDFKYFFEKKMNHGLTLINYARAYKNFAAINIIFKKSNEFALSPANGDNTYNDLNFAIEKNDFKELEKEIERCIPYNSINNFLSFPNLKETNDAFERLIQQGRIDILQMLEKLDNNFSTLFSLCNKKGEDGLALSVLHQQPQLVEFFFTRIPKSRDFYFNRAFAYCALNKNKEIFLLLLKYLVPQDNYYHHQLLNHIFDNDIAAIKKILEAHKELDIEERMAFNNLMPLALAAAMGHTEIVDLLLLHSVSIIGKENHAFTLKSALIYALFCQENEIAKKLLEFKDIIFSSIHMNAENSLEPWEAAAQANNLHMLEFFKSKIQISTILKIADTHDNLYLIVWLNSYYDSQKPLLSALVEILQKPNENIYYLRMLSFIKKAILKRDDAALHICLQAYSSYLYPLIHSNIHAKTDNAKISSVILFAILFGNHEILLQVHKTLNINVFNSVQIYLVRELLLEDMSDLEQVLGKEILRKRDISIFKLLYVRERYRFLLEYIKTFRFPEERISAVNELTELLQLDKNLCSTKKQFFHECCSQLLQLQNHDIVALTTNIRSIIQPVIHKTIFKSSINQDEHQEKISAFLNNVTQAASFQVLQQTLTQFTEQYQTNQPLNLLMTYYISFIQKCMDEHHSNDYIKENSENTLGTLS